MLHDPGKKEALTMAEILCASQGDKVPGVAKLNESRMLEDIHEETA